MIKDIIDISHDNPVYDPRNFGNGIKYHKLPTVSKIPPTDAVCIVIHNLMWNHALSTLLPVHITSI